VVRLRTRALVLLGLGVFLLALAPMIRFYIAPKLTQLPPNYYFASTAAATDATVFDLTTLKERPGAEITLTRTIKGDAGASSSSVAVWDVFTNINDETGKQIDYTQSRLALDRSTGLPVHCCRENVNSDRTKQFSGITYKFPFDTEKKAYEVFDDKTGRTWSAAFQGTEKVKGLTTYRFTQNIEPTKIREREVPAQLVKEPGTSVMAGVFYGSTRTYWVEPKTGIIVKGRDEARTFLRGPAGHDGVTIVAGNIVLSDRSQSELVSRAKNARTMLFVLEVLAPVICGVLGLVLILFSLRGVRGRDPKRAGNHAAGGPVPARTQPA
jgi:Porin PorA